jgi:hypothetical protein
VREFPLVTTETETETGLDHDWIALAHRSLPQPAWAWAPRRDWSEWLRQLKLLPLSPTAQCYVAVYEAHAHASAKRLDLALQALDSAAAWSDETKTRPRRLG